LKEAKLLKGFVAKEKRCEEADERKKVGIKNVQ